MRTVRQRSLRMYPKPAMSASNAFDVREIPVTPLSGTQDPVMVITSEVMVQMTTVSMNGSRSAT